MSMEITPDDVAVVNLTTPEPVLLPEEDTIVTNEHNDDVERIVYDYDDQGEVIGWHKELVQGAAPTEGSH